MKRIVIAVTLALFFGLAHAEPYAVVSTGLAKTKAGGIAATDMPLSIGGGFRFNKTFTVEAAYIDLNVAGDHEESGSSLATVTNGSQLTITKREWSGKGVGLSLLAFHPISPSTQLVGKVGAVRIRSETKSSEDVQFLSNTVGVPSTRTIMDTTTMENIWAPNVAVGLQGLTNGEVSFRAMVEYTRGHGEFKSAAGVSVSFMYSF